MDACQWHNAGRDSLEKKVKLQTNQHRFDEFVTG